MAHLRLNNLILFLIAALVSAGALASVFGIKHHNAPDEDAQEILEYALKKEAMRPSTIRSELARSLSLQPRQTLSGSYLSSLYAQNRHDWETAHSYMKTVLDQTEDTDSPIYDTLLKRAIVLAAGSGHYQKAFEWAETAASRDNEDPLPRIFLAVKSFKEARYENATAHIKAMPDGTIPGFIMPILESWAAASAGDKDIDELQNNNMHFYHAILISRYLGEEPEKIRDLIARAIAMNPQKTLHIERLGDMMADIGDFEEAARIYNKILEAVPNHTRIAEKRDKARKGEKIAAMTPPATPSAGIAHALYDLALLLFHDYSDESARVFAHLAHYLDPDMTRAKILLASLAARNENSQLAIDYYNKIEPESDYYLETRMRIAQLYESDGEIDRALQKLEDLITTHQHIPAQIEKGDINRRNDHYDKAIDAYNEAFSMLGGSEDLPDQYWHLHYVRGMAYERAGQWDKAETDLLAALEYRPDDPYVLNYLGYSWADQGKNLQQSLDMIRRAVEAEPNNGFIADSLGWVYYRLGNYDQALGYLEKAVQLEPYDAVINDHLGDVYWKLGRKLEARYQWQRARNYAEDDEEKLITGITEKLENGLPSEPVIMEAKSGLDNPQAEASDPQDEQTF